MDGLSAHVHVSHVPGTTDETQPAQIGEKEKQATSNRASFVDSVALLQNLRVVTLDHYGGPLIYRTLQPLILTAIGLSSTPSLF